MSTDWYHSILEAAPPAKPDSGDLQRDTSESAVFCARVNAHLDACGLRHVHAAFDRGVLAISGHVDSLYERQLAVYYVRKFTQRTGISDRICVRNLPQRPGLRERISEFLAALRVAAGDWWSINKRAAWVAIVASVITVIAIFRNGETASAHVPVHPVSGAVHVDGIAPVGAQIILHPQGHLLPEGAAAMGHVREDGTFSVNIYGDVPGVPPGEYIATLHWFKHRGEGATPVQVSLPTKYSSPKSSPLKVRVEAGINRIPVIDIVLK